MCEADEKPVHNEKLYYLHCYICKKREMLSLTNPKDKTLDEVFAQKKGELRKKIYDQLY